MKHSRVQANQIESVNLCSFFPHIFLFVSHLTNLPTLTMVTNWIILITILSVQYQVNMFRATKLIKQHYWHLANSSWLKNSINVSTTYSIEDEEWNKSERIEAKTCYDVRRHFTFQCGDHLHSNYTMDRNCTSKEKILVYRRASIRYQCTVIIDSNNCRQFQKWPPSANKLIPVQCRDVQISLLIPESAGTYTYTYMNDILY